MLKIFNLVLGVFVVVSLANRSSFAMGKRRPVTPADHIIRCTDKLLGGGTSVKVIDLRAGEMTDLESNGDHREFSAISSVKALPVNQGYTVEITASLIVGPSNPYDVVSGKFDISGSLRVLETNLPWPARAVDKTLYKDGNEFTSNYETQCYFVPAD